MQAADQRMREMHERMESQEQRQNTIVNFLARVAQNPTVLQQMVSVAQSAGLQRLSSQRGGGATAEEQVAPQQQCCIMKATVLGRITRCVRFVLAPPVCVVWYTNVFVCSAKPLLAVLRTSIAYQQDVVLRCGRVAAPVSVCRAQEAAWTQRRRF
jgi:hypothetical protein